MTLLPEDPDESARRLRERIEAIDSNFGRTDLYDQPKIGGVDLVADELTSGSALLFGQADEQIPTCQSQFLRLTKTFIILGWPNPS